MEDFRSKSYKDGKLQIEPYYGGGTNPNINPSGMKDLRSYSVNYSSNGVGDDDNKEMKMKKWKSSRVGSASKKWSLSLIGDPELQRKKRVAGYKVYSVEGNIKGSLRKSFRWIKNHVVHGWW